MNAQVKDFCKQRNQYQDAKPTPEERREAETKAFAEGRRHSVSNSHAQGCECPICKPGDWQPEAKK